MVHSFPAVHASMNFIADLPLYNTEKPYNCKAKDLPGGEISNLVFERKDGVLVSDIRGHEDEFTLEEHGFSYLKHESQVKDAIGSVEFVYAYIKETVQWLKDRFDAKTVVCYDLRIRRNVPQEQVTGDIDDRSTAMYTVQDVHVDQTIDGGFQRIKRHIRQDEVEECNTADWQAMIVNVWRPLRHEVEDAPLAFCDFRSVHQEDLLAADRVYETYNGEIYYMKHNENQRWYYVGAQKPDEVALFMSFISDPGEAAKFCPHVSFHDPRAALDCRKRESVELRAIIIRQKSSSILRGRER